MNEERNRQSSPKSGLLPDFVSTLSSMTSEASFQRLKQRRTLIWSETINTHPTEDGRLTSFTHLIQVTSGRGLVSLGRAQQRTTRSCESPAARLKVKV